MAFKASDLDLLSDLLNAQDRTTDSNIEYSIGFETLDCKYNLALGMRGGFAMLSQYNSNALHRWEYIFGCNELVFHSSNTKESYRIGFIDRQGTIYYPRLLLAGGKYSVRRVCCYGIAGIEGDFAFPQQWG